MTPLVSGRNMYTQKHTAALRVKQVMGLMSSLCRYPSRAGLMTSDSPPISSRIDAAALTLSGNSQFEQISTITYRKLVLNRNMNSKTISTTAVAQKSHSLSLVMNVSAMAAPVMTVHRIRLPVFLLRVPMSVKAGTQTVKSADARTVPTRQGLRLKESTRMEDPQQSVRMRNITMKQSTETLLSDGNLQRISGFTLQDCAVPSFWITFAISAEVIICPLLISAILLSTFIISFSPFLARYLGISGRQQMQKMNPATAGRIMKMVAVILQSAMKQLPPQMRRYPRVQNTCTMMEYFSLIWGWQYSVRKLKVNFMAPSVPQFTRNSPNPVTQMLMELIAMMDPAAINPLKRIIRGRLPKESTRRARRKTLTRKPKQTNPYTTLTYDPEQYWQSYSTGMVKEEKSLLRQCDWRAEGREQTDLLQSGVRRPNCWHAYGCMRKKKVGPSCPTPPLQSAQMNSHTSRRWKGPLEPTFSTRSKQLRHTDLLTAGYYCIVIIKCLPQINKWEQDHCAYHFHNHNLLHLQSGWVFQPNISQNYSAVVKKLRYVRISVCFGMFG